MEPTTIYYSIKGVALIAKVAISYQKTAEVKSITETYKQNVEDQQIINESISDFLCLIRNDIQKLMHVYFASAYKNLDYALKAQGNNRKEYLVQARNRFIDASTIEKNENLILTYLGLSLCQNLLDDVENAKTTLKKISSVKWEDIYSDNPDIVLNDWDDEWMYILLKISVELALHMNLSPFASSINENDLDDFITSQMFGREDPSFEYRKQKYLKRLKALIKCDGFCMDKKRLKNS